jgi:hypothetical protein
MYKDIVIKKRVWMPEDDILDAWDIFDVDEEIEYETTIVDFNGRIPVEDGVIVGEWMTNGIQLIKADMGELLSEGEGMIQTVKTESIEEMISLFAFSNSAILPTGIFIDKYTTAVQLSNGQYQVTVNLKYFQYIYNADFDYEVNSDVLVLKRDGLVCGAVSGMNWHNNMNPIWQRPYSLADVEALTSIQGDPTLP